jgi:hypothetical protein
MKQKAVVADDVWVWWVGCIGLETTEIRVWWVGYIYKSQNAEKCGG